MRGKVARGFLKAPPKRITPAHAGKSPPAAVSSSIIRDHPRACGEKLGNLFLYDGHPGSPPAHAGKSCRQRIPAGCPGDHPRACGEKYLVIECPELPQGSPPRMRRDHPRACGEKFCRVVTMIRAPGSPPRMRGKASYRVIPKYTPGITPALAGKSFQVKVHSKFSQDHPRACREKLRGAF